MEGKGGLVEVHMKDKEASYLRMQLNKRIEARNLKDIKTSVVNNVFYLEKT
jgi:hypothetical protein